MIGQYGFFDQKKLNKDYRERFYGIEACLLETEDDILILQKEAKRKKLNIGIHFPLRSGIYSSRDPLFLDLNCDIRKKAFDDIEKELNFIIDKNINPAYILFHYPKPVIISDKFDINRWKFGSSSEYVYESEYRFENLVEYSKDLFRWLSKKSIEYNFTPVLELDAINKYIIKTSFLEDLLEIYTNIKLCIDIGRLHIQDKIDPQFNGKEILKRFIKYTEVLHLWNAKVGETVKYGHYPLLPTLNLEEGWLDVEAIFKIIRSENKNIKFFFEHRSDLVNEEELNSCYKWINDLINFS